MDKYLRILRMCQMSGHRIGAIQHNGWCCIAYLLDGRQYRFRHGFYRISSVHDGETVQDWTKD